MKNKFYFAYGSNLNKKQMSYRCPQAEALGKAYLDDYKLTFKYRNPSSGVATIEPEKGECVPGGLWKITSSCLQALDRYEGYPILYDRDIFEVKLPEGKTVECFSYFMIGDLVSVGPSESYLNSITEGYKDFGIDLDYILNKTFKK